MSAPLLSWRAAWQVASAAGCRPLVWSTAFVVAQAALPVFGLLAMQHLVDAIVAGASGTAEAGAAWSTAAWAVAAAAAVAVGGNLLRALAAVRSETHGRLLADVWSLRVQEHTARLDLAEFDRPAFHDLLHRAGTEAGTRPVRLVQDLQALTSAVVGFTSMVAVVASVSFWLPLGVAAAAAPIAWSRRREARRRFDWQASASVAQREVAYLGGLLTGRATAKEVRALGLLAFLRERLMARRASLRGALGELAQRRAVSECLVHTLAGLGLFGAYLYVAHRALLGEVTVGGLVLHAQALQRVQNGVRDLLGAWAAVGEDRLFLVPLQEFVARVPGLQAGSPVATAPAGPMALAANEVSFTYPEQAQPALAGVSVRIEAGERVAIVGPNGSGKSTLVKLLCRLYDPTTGTITSQGVDLRCLEPESFRARVACLFQDAHAFEGTLAENLRLGHRTTATDAALANALEVVGLAARVRELPLGLATPLSRRLPCGVEWSSGELRRLLLARTLAQAADLLLLDEPFAALDGPAADALATALRSGDRMRTVVVVDHRRTVLTCVDRVVVLERGRVVAVGTPEELAAGDRQISRLFPEAGAR